MVLTKFCNHFPSLIALGFMKIRIKGNSLRYRLTKSEVAAFSEKGYLEEKTLFPTQTLVYALQAKADIDTLAADFSENVITLFFPESEQVKWHESNQVGYQNTFILPNGESLFLLIEKDFVCLDNTDEDQSDNYENPNAVC
jgi:hypothetical protein